MKKPVLILGLLFGAMVTFAVSQIDSRWRKPGWNGIYPGYRLMENWPERGPQIVWAFEGLGDEYSSPAVVSNRVYVTGMIRGEEFLFALDLNGCLHWKLSYGSEWEGSRPGARSTPTVFGNRLYLMSAEGRAICADRSGQIVWTVDLVKTFGARNLQRGMTESPLVDGDHVFFTPGGRNGILAALDGQTGQTVWEIGGNGKTSGYCSPFLVKKGDRRLFLTMTGKALIGIDVDTGELLWRHARVNDYVVNANTPLYYNGYVYVVSGYGTDGQMFKLVADGKSIERIWAQRKMESQVGAAVLVDGNIYGSGHQSRGWHCLDWKTGEVHYTARAIGNKGAVIFAEGG